jgi:LPPG:FO 2-phospho-L-lactate transferase
VLTVALAGGVGAAKFLRGLLAVADPHEVAIVVNTGDDAVFHGLHISPDIDIVTYTLAGIVDPVRGWGIAWDTTHALDQIAKLGIDTWFRLGDRDLAVHLARTTWLQEGLPLSKATDRIRKALGLACRILPMSDDPVRTKVTTTEGVTRDFQEYFVRYRHSEDVSSVRMEGAASATPAPGVIDAIQDAQRIIICPSNPILSIGPILAVKDIWRALRSRRDDVFAISPIVQGAALKGPADRLMHLGGVDASAAGVARLYSRICANFVLDHRDADVVPDVESLDMRPLVLETIMDVPHVAEQLAKEILSA